MFAVNLKSLNYCDSFKLTKNVYCNVFRSGLLQKAQPTKISHRCYVEKFQENANQKHALLTVRSNNIICRHITFKKTRNILPSPIKWKSVLILAIFGSVFLAIFMYLKEKKLKKIEAYRNKQLGKVQLGGRFDLVDHNNKPLSSEDLLGDWLLLYFGFTHCPDICPEEIEKMVEVINIIDQNKSMMKVKPIFITVDPQRDTPSIIEKYLKEFSDKIIGLTGTVEQIAAVCKSFRVYFSPGPKDSDADYIVDHSIIMYLIDPEGKFIDFYGQNKNAKDIVDSIYFNQKKQEINKSTLSKIQEFFSKE